MPNSEENLKDENTFGVELREGYIQHVRFEVGGVVINLNRVAALELAAWIVVVAGETDFWRMLGRAHMAQQTNQK